MPKSKRANVGTSAVVRLVFAVVPRAARLQNITLNTDVAMCVVAHGVWCPAASSPVDEDEGRPKGAQVHRHRNHPPVRRRVQEPVCYFV